MSTLRPSQSTRPMTLRSFQSKAPTARKFASQIRPITTTPTTNAALDPRWLTILKRRVGKCLMFGLKPAQVDEAGRILQRLAKDWRELTAGSEGFLTSHINNVAYARYAETARVNLMHNYAMHIDPAHQTEWLNTVGNKGIGLILQGININYKFPMTWPDKITVYHRLTQDPSETLAKSFFQQEVLILSESKQRPAARVLEQNFLFDYRKLSKTGTAPEFISDQFRRTWQMQEESKTEWQQQVADVENAVRRLELDSWDNPDAVEDMGSAGRR
ncbi:hypothetical protein UA08_04828 [Talaromyces atroroseus]|uniref:Uncharacterized protein n=1 Tax=Talaromyces atroroseus TaxID=1441469 RepID=A0A225AHI1_TALAT|nr:hypothetical protein UA08_04828 [Talaromyces atroroseus]OKL60210.1 hypothetical protein UA08_04828 [Talaromyces atroroseus]